MAKTVKERPFVTTPQAAIKSGLSKNYLAKMLRSGRLEGFRVGRDWAIYQDSLDLFLASQRKPGPKGPRKANLITHRSEDQNPAEIASHER